MGELGPVIVGATAQRCRQLLPVERCNRGQVPACDRSHLHRRIWRMTSPWMHWYRPTRSGRRQRVRTLPPCSQIVIPIRLGSQQIREVNENSPPGTKVGKPVAAGDAGDILTYALVDNDNGDNGLYSIDPATGQITVASRAMLNAEAAEGDRVEGATGGFEHSGHGPGH